jgi:acrylyl-CoA reductase (NADPH)
MELATTVLAFMLRGVKLIGINANSPMALREQVWRRLASDLRPRHLARIAEPVAFEELPQAMARMRARGTQGRLLVVMA